jgi:hypothetical protein
MRLVRVFLIVGISFAIAGCQGEHPSIGIGREVTIETLEAGRDSARFRASVVSGGKHTRLDYAAALLQAGGKACSPRTLSVEDQSPDLGAGGLETAPEAGTTLTMTVACGHDRIPGHRVATEAEAMSLHGSSPPGSSDKSASRAMPKNETRLVTAEGLIGGFVREAYTEDCAGRGLIVEKIELASVPVEPGSGTPYVEKMHGTMHFRCMEAAPDEPQVADSASN